MAPFGSSAAGRAWQRPRSAATPAEPALQLCLLRSCWTTRRPCADTARPGAAAPSWASSACWWAMGPWARPASSSATPPTGTPTSTSPPPSTPSQVRAHPHGLAGWLYGEGEGAFILVWFVSFRGITALNRRLAVFN